jgi:hypothetical protein
MQPRAVVLAAVALVIVSVAPARAQAPRPVALELRGGAAIPLGSFRKRVGTGTSYGALAELRLHRIVGLYAGYDHDSFGTRDDAELGGRAMSGDVESSAIRLGVQWALPVGGGPLQPFLRTGVLFDRVTAGFEGSGGAREEESDRITAFNVEAGAGISFARSVAIVPGIRYYSLYPRFRAADPRGRAELHLQHLTLTLGLRVSP